MKRKPIRIDWDELEAAFDNPNEELVYFLDLVDGHVVLEGEGEEDDFDDDDEGYVPAQPAVNPPDDRTRAYVDRLTTETKIDWFRRFVGEADDLDAEWAKRLEQALQADDPTQAIIDALAENADGKERWYRYRADRLHEMIDTWLELHEVALVEPPPWR